MWSCIAGSLKIKVQWIVHTTALWDQIRWPYNQGGLKMKGCKMKGCKMKGCKIVYRERTGQQVVIIKLLATHRSNQLIKIDLQLTVGILLPVVGVPLTKHPSVSIESIKSWLWQACPKCGPLLACTFQIARPYSRPLTACTGSSDPRLEIHPSCLV